MESDFVEVGSVNDVVVSVVDAVEVVVVGLDDGGVSITEDEEARVLLGARAPTSGSQPLSPF